MIHCRCSRTGPYPTPASPRSDPRRFGSPRQVDDLRAVAAVDVERGVAVAQALEDLEARWGVRGQKSSRGGGREGASWKGMW